MEAQTRKRALLVKKPFTRVISKGHDDVEREVRGIPSMEQPDFNSIVRVKVTQDEFLRELDPLGHLIYNREYYPDIWRQDPDTGKWYVEEIPRHAFAFQKIILVKHLTHLCGNDIVFELADDKDDEHSRDILNAFKRGWAKKNMEIAWYELAKSIKGTGDGAIVGYIENGEFGWRSLSFEKGDTLYPHYSRRTGKIELFARQYHDYDDNGDAATFVDIWDNRYYIRLVQDNSDREIKKDGGETQQAAPSIAIPADALLNGYDISGYRVDECAKHGFRKIPVAYHRNEEGPCWSWSQETIDQYELAFSKLAQSNGNFGLPIMYVKGEGSEELTSQDMSYASKVIVLPSDGEAGFLNRQDASNAYKSQLDMMETMIYRMSFAVRTPELKSGDTPGVAIKMLYSDAYEKALNDAQEYQHAIEELYEMFCYGYGVESEMRLDFNATPISFYISPYIHVNETERTTILATAVQNGFCSKQTASEKFTLATPQEKTRLLREKHDEEMQKLLLQQQTLEMQNDENLEYQEQLSDIQTDAQIEVAQAQAKIEQDSGNSVKKVSIRKGSVSTGRGRGRPRTVNTDQWGNRANENNWNSWNATH